MEGGAHLYKHLHSSHKRLTCLPNEMGRNVNPTAGPDLPSGFGDEFMAIVVFLHKFQIAVAVVFINLAEFGLQPTGLATGLRSGLFPTM